MAAGSRRKLTASPVAMVTCSKLPSEDGSVISDESERLRSGRGLMVLKVTAQQRATKEEARKQDGERQASHAPLRWEDGLSRGGVAWEKGTRKAGSHRIESVAPAGGATTSRILVAGTASSRLTAETDVMNTH